MTVAEYTREKLETGIYPGVPFDRYLNIEGMSNSTLMWGRKSMAHLKAAMDGYLVREDTEALAFGRGLHTRILEPNDFERRYLIAQPCAAILKNGPNKGEACGREGRTVRDDKWYCGTHSSETDCLPEGVEVLSESDRVAIEAAAEAVKHHPAERLRRAHGDYEVALVGDLMGVRCKGRLDKLIPNPLTIIDVKKVAAPGNPSAPSGAAEEFEKRIAGYGYGMQAAMYCDLVQQNTGNMPRWFWIVVEDSEPHCVGVYKADDSLIAAGRNEYKLLLTEMKRCQDTKVWPGFSSDVTTIYGPDWWQKKFGGLQ